MRFNQALAWLNNPSEQHRPKQNSNLLLTPTYRSILSMFQLEHTHKLATVATLAQTNNKEAAAAAAA